MRFRTHAGLLIYFECERCHNECDATKDRMGNWGRAFCNKCGAAYALWLHPSNAGQIERISFGEKYMPADRRTFRRRLGDFLRNR